MKIHSRFFHIIVNKSKAQIQILLQLSNVTKRLASSDQSCHPAGLGPGSGSGSGSADQTLSAIIFIFRSAMSVCARCKSAGAQSLSNILGRAVIASPVLSPRVLIAANLYRRIVVWLFIDYRTLFFVKVGRTNARANLQWPRGRGCRLRPCAPCPIISIICGIVPVIAQNYAYCPSVNRANAILAHFKRLPNSLRDKAARCGPLLPKL
jgi:hypothetical protein